MVERPLAIAVAAMPARIVSPDVLAGTLPGLACPGFGGPGPGYGIPVRVGLGDLLPLPTRGCLSDL